MDRARRWPFVPLAEAGVSVLDCEHKTPKDAGEGHPYIAIPNLVDGHLDLSDVRRITDEDLKTWTRRTVPLAGDVIVTRRGRVGDTAVIPRGLQCAIGQNLVLLRSDGTRVDQRFLRWATRGAIWGAEVDRLRNVGAVFDSLNVRDITKLRIPVPSLAEQRAITEVLDVIDRKTASNRRLASSLMDHARLAFRAKFGGRIEGGVPLREHVNVVRGRSYKSSELSGDDCALVTLKSVLAGGGYNPSGLKPYSGEFKSNQVVQPGELVVAHTDLTQAAAVVGKPALVPDRGRYATLVASLDLAIVRPASDRLSVPFLYFLFLEPAFQQHAYGHSNGSTVLHMSKEAIPSFTVTLPKQEELQGLDQLAGPIIGLANGLLAEAQALVAVRDVLLSRLLSGDITVTAEAQAAVTEIAA